MRAVRALAATDFTTPFQLIGGAQLLQRILITLISNPLALIAASTPFVVNHMKEKTASLAAEAAHRASELKEASDIANEISGSMDKLAYYSREAMFTVVFQRVSNDKDQTTWKPQDVVTWKSFQDALAAWEGFRTTACARTALYFGEDNARRLETIQRDFVTLKNQIDAAYYKRTTSKWFIEDKEGSKDDFRGKFMRVWNRLTDLMTEQSKEMIRQIQYEEVGSLKGTSKG
jgi:hypothetical protein